MAHAVSTSDIDQVIAGVEESLSVIYGRARLMWRDAATNIHPQLQPLGYKILSVIVRLGETNAHVLAGMLETDKSLVSRQVRMLEEAHLVVSHADTRDGRARVLAPTPEAIERVRAVRTQQQGRLRDILRSQPDSEVRAFARILDLVSDV